MAATLTGAPVVVNWGTAQNPSAQNITIPADATAVYILWAYYNGTPGHGIASATLAGDAPDQLLEAPTAAPDKTSTGVAAWYNPPTGVQALDVAWDAAPAEGPTFVVAFIKGGNTVSWRDADVFSEFDTGAVSVTLTTEAGDLVLRFDQRYIGQPTQGTNPPALTAGWTDHGTQVQNSEGARLSSIVAAGATQVCTVASPYYSTIAAVSIPESVATPAPTITDVDTDETITSTQTNVVVTGTGFSAATAEIRQGSVSIEQSIDSQSGTTLQFDLVFDPGAPGSGPHLKYGSATLAIINADEQEATIALTIAPPSGVAYVDLSTPATTGDNRITAVEDLAAGDQLEISNVQGGTIDDVTVNADATFEVAESVTAFDVRAWDASDATWGAIGTQTVAGEAIEGGLSATLDSLSAEAGGSVSISGTAEDTLEAATADAGGNVDIAGSGDLVLDDATLDASAEDENSGSLEQTLDEVAIEGSGSVSIEGSGAAQLDDLQSSAPPTEFPAISQIEFGRLQQRSISFALRG